MNGPTTSSVRRWPWCRLAAHVVLVWHVFAVAVGPASIPPSSGVQRHAWSVAGPYLQALFLNHGYHFFAPDPGESTLVDFVAYRQDGSEVRGRIPNLNDSRPRLLYHRDFMLTESLPGLDGLDPDDRTAYYQALADGLGLRHDAARVRLARVTHYLPTPAAVRAGFPVDDPEQFVSVDLGTFTCRR